MSELLHGGSSEINELDRIIEVIAAVASCYESIR